MTWQTHVACGVCSLWLLAWVPVGDLPSGGFGVLAAAAALGALAPDLDARVSKLSMWTVAGVRPLHPIASVLSRALGHRGPMHSWPGLVAAGAGGLIVAQWLSWPIGLAAWLGYASHLAADSCTISGIPLGRGKRRFWLAPPRLRIVTGSQVEDIVFAITASSSLGLLLHGLAHSLT